jgi:AraC family transcriptional regulator
MSTALRIMHGVFGRVALLDMDRRLVRHAHPHCHVLLKVDGDDTQFLVGDAIAPLTNTSAVLVNAWQTHAYVHDPARRDALILALYIEPEWLRGFRPNWEASGGPGFFEKPVGEVTPQIRRLAHDLAEEMVHGPAASPDREDLLSSLMIAVIERFTPWRSIGQSLREVAWRHNMDRRIRRSIALMRANLSASPAVEMLAREAGLSRAHFFRTFQRSTGLSPHVFLNVLRVEMAVAAIVDSGEALAGISDRLGFSAPAHFTRFFRDHVSVAPSEFRSVIRLDHPEEIGANQLLRLGGGQSPLA